MVNRDDRLRVSRRGFLKASGVGAVGMASSIGVVPLAQSAAAQGTWDAEHDVVVVGSGSAAFAAAITAKSAGADVVMFEKGAYVGGTTLASGGGGWFPNNVVMQADGHEDPKEEAVKYMARYSYPALYSPEHETLGLPQHDFDMLNAYYDTSIEATTLLQDVGAIKWVYGQGFGPNFDEIQTDYMDHFEENLSPQYRTLHPDNGEGGAGGGGNMIGGYQAWTEENGVPIHLLHKVSQIVVNSSGEIVGVEVTVLPADGGTPEATPVSDDQGTKLMVRARKGVIFGSGGFGKNQDMMHNLMPFPYLGGCSAPTNEGDLLTMATQVGAKLGNLHNVWRNQSVFEQAVANSAGYNCTWFLNGDSFMLVNKNGKRFVNEKRSYQDRPMAHLDYDPNNADWTNRLGFYIHDQRQQDNWGGMFPLSRDPENTPYVLMGDTLEELAAKIEERVNELAPVTGGIKLSEDFAASLVAEVEKYNGFAAAGVDEDFKRGDYGYDTKVPYGPRGENSNLEVYPSDDQPNVAMYPLSAEGPYYAFIMTAAAVDTSGGPVINTDGQIIRWDGSAIEGLYGAGNCVASASVNAYWGGGATIGNATVWGYQAAMHAVAAPEKSAN